MVTGIFAGVIALLFDIEILSKVVSVGTLFALCLVSLGILARRYRRKEELPSRSLVASLTLLIASAVFEGFAFALEWHVGFIVVFLGECFLHTSNADFHK